MFWIVALAAAGVVGSLVRHAWQDYRDAELQRRDALDDIARPRASQAARAPRALPAASEPDRTRDAGRERAPSATGLPRDPRPSTGQSGRML